MTNIITIGHTTSNSVLPQQQTLLYARRNHITNLRLQQTLPLIKNSNHHYHWIKQFQHSHQPTNSNIIINETISNGSNKANPNQKEPIKQDQPQSLYQTITILFGLTILPPSLIARPYSSMLWVSFPYVLCRGLAIWSKIG